MKVVSIDDKFVHLIFDGAKSSEYLIFRSLSLKDGSLNGR